MIRTVFALLLLIVIPVALAQPADCPALVTQAYESVKNACTNTGRNQSCYGNFRLTAAAREGANLTFEKVGDIADVATIQSLQLSPMNTAESYWGVVLMKLQANVPDSLPGQNVEVLLFGDVEITSAVDASDTSAAPMHAFYFKSGFRDRPCAEAPDSGLVVQGPKGLTVQLTINGVDIAMNSTLFLQTTTTDGQNRLKVNVAEGSARLTSGGVSQIVPAGTFSSVEIEDYDDLLDEEEDVAGVPTFPEAYEDDDLSALPLDDGLFDEDVEIAAPLDDDDIQAMIDDLADDFDDLDAEPIVEDETEDEFRAEDIDTGDDGGAISEPAEMGEDG